MWTRAAGLALLVAGQSAAQEPLSAIDWLSESVEAAPRSVLPGVVTVQPLGAPPRSIGFLQPESVGLPSTIWAGSDARDLVAGLDRMSTEMPLPLRETLTTLLAVDAPADDPEGAFVLARVDTLLALGQVHAARRLAEEAGLDDPEMFRRAFDIALLTGQEDAECRRLRSRPGIEATYPARIFCFARLGDWQGASLTLGNGEALGVLTPDEVAILGRFLNDGEEDALPPPERPATITPLTFRLYEAIGAPLATRGLPLAFAHADLRHQNGWKTRIEAAERLYRAGAIPGETLMSLYLEREPAASGGVWDRVAAVRAWHEAKPDDQKEAADAAAEVLAEAGVGRLLGREAADERVAALDDDAVPDPDLAEMIAEGRKGEAALQAILRAADAWDGDPDDLSRALAALEAVGFDLTAPGEAPQWASRR